MGLIQGGEGHVGVGRLNLKWVGSCWCGWAHSKMGVGVGGLILRWEGHVGVIIQMGRVMLVLVGFIQSG